MLAGICFIIAVVICVVNVFFEGTIRIEWILGFIALGLFFTVYVVPISFARRERVP